MRVLIVKTSSMGDLIHTLPALSDAAKVYPHIEFDWVVEENFQQIPGWHKHVKTILPVALRRWRKSWLKAFFTGELKKCLTRLRQEKYDAVIDAQGLVKSAFLTRFCRGRRYGLSWSSAREPLASVFYNFRAEVNFKQHAIIRSRALFAKSLGYPLFNTPPDYGIDFSRLTSQEKKLENKDPYLVFLHGTTWATKHWPETHWIQLGKLAAKAGFRIKLLWGNTIERLRAERIKAQVPEAGIADKMGLTEIAALLSKASGVVSVDTGLGHLAAALSVPMVSIYGPTNPKFTGAYGQDETHLVDTQFDCVPCLKRSCSYPGVKTPEPPCMNSISPHIVWQRLCSLVEVNK